MYKYKILLLSKYLNVLQYIEPFQNGIKFFSTVSAVTRWLRLNAILKRPIIMYINWKKYYKCQVCTWDGSIQQFKSAGYFK